MGAILVPIIVGGAVLAAAILLWEAHSRKAAGLELSRTEVAVRRELRAGYAAVRRGQADDALAHAATAGEMLSRRLRGRWRTEYLELRMARNLITAEATLLLERPDGPAAAEALLTEALGWLTQTGGSYWQALMLARGRARLAGGRSGEAAADLDLLLERNPNFASAYYWRALARRDAGDVPGAEADETRARRLGAWPPVELRVEE